MDFTNISTLEFERFVLILVRVSSLLLSAPLFSAPAVPTIVKIGLSVAVSLAFFPIAGSGFVASEIPFYDLAFLALGEVFLGLSMGILTRFFVVAADMGAEVMGFQMGFGVVTAIDPNTQGHTALLSQLQGVTTALMILMTNTHYFFFQAIAESFKRIPLMGFYPSPDLWAIFMVTTKEVFVLALKFAAPVVAVLMLSSIALGIVARTVPQMNIFIVGLSLQIFIGLSILALSLPMLGVLYSQVLADIGGSMFRFVRAF